MISYLIKKRKITLLFFLLVLLVGCINLFQLPKQDNPDVTINQAIVTTIYPGASPEKVEQTVTKKMEQKIKELQGIKKITSTSSLGASIITVETKDGVDAKQKWEELRKKVQDAEADLPIDSKKPTVNDDLNRSFVQTFAVYADSIDQIYSLRELSKTWKDQLRTIPGVADVTIEGIPDEEVHVEIDTQKLQQYQLGWGQILSAVKGENEKVPIGELDIKLRTYQLQVTESHHPEALDKVILTRTKEGSPIYLKDVGKAALSHEKPSFYTYFNGKPAVSISINAELGSDVPTIYQHVNVLMASLKKQLPTWAHMESVYSQNERVDEQFRDLAREMVIAVVAVIMVCTMGLNVITAIIVALSIPLSMALGMLFLPMFGITLNFISIVALMIVLGILVDDAVVVNDNIERRLTVLHESPNEAAVRGAKEVSISIITATLATISAFAPLLFLKGNPGKFIKPIPVIIILTMLASLIISLTIIPIFRDWHESRNSRRKEGSSKPSGFLGKPLDQLTKWYAQTFMPKVLKRPLLVGMIGMIASTAAYGLIPFTPVQLFPHSDRAQFIVQVRLPMGTSIEKTKTLVKDVSDWIQKQPGVNSVAGYAGGSAPNMFGGADTRGDSGAHAGQLVVFTDKKNFEMEKRIENWMGVFQEKYPEAMITPKQLVTGPPVGKPISIRIYGEDIPELRTLTEQVKDVMVKTKGTYDIRDDLDIDRYTLDFAINKDVMDSKLVNYTSLTQSLRLISEGLTTSQFDTGKDVIDLKLFMNKNQEDPSILFQRLTVTNARGEQIPLTQMAKINPSFSIQKITHYNLGRSVTITADVKGKTATEAMKEIKQELNKLSLPEGYRWEAAGETSEQKDIFIDMGKLSIVVAFLIIVMIAMQFYSISLPLLVMSTVYLSTAGAIIGLFLTRTPLGFMTMMGIISLAGIVVRNGIVLIEFIEQARHAGMELKEAVIQAGQARLRPILLTSMTAVAGLLPIAITGDVLFKPLAITIIFGLIFSTLLTLVVVPSFYTVLTSYKEKRTKKKSLVKTDPPSISLN